MKKGLPKSFEEALQKLEEITEIMQHSDLPLEEALAAYQNGLEMVQFCRRKLDDVERKLQLLDDDTLEEFPVHEG